MLNETSVREMLLSCNHIVRYRVPLPKKGQMVTCMRCCAERQIVRKIDEYKVQCQNCAYARGFGMDLDGAGRRAVYHARGHAHDVDVKQADEIINTVIGSQEMITLSLPNMTPETA